MIIDDTNTLIHYGTPRHSGRYPWGSGGDSTTTPRNPSFLDYIDDLKRQGLTDQEIAVGLGMKSTEYRNRRSIAIEARKAAQITQAERLRQKGLSNVAIGERMGLAESSVRALLAPAAKERADRIRSTADMLKAEVENKQYVDVGAQTENYANVSNTRFKAALQLLKDEGYKVQYLQVPQLGTGLNTTQPVLTKATVTYSELYRNRDKVQQIQSYSDTDGDTWVSIKAPKAISSKRVGINYAEQGGSNADGVIYVRPGVSDVSLGHSHYAQVRVLVDGTHYLKGMAMYKEGLPDGVDLVFNTNKSDTGHKQDAMKPIGDDPTNPFGSMISRQIGVVAGDPTRQKPTSVMNIVNEEGAWSEWSKTISSQMLSKQSPVLAKTQLNMTYERRKQEYDEIVSLTNPVVKKKLLEDFADSADSAAVHLKAAGFDGQSTHVILPIGSMPPTQVYAPNYADGTRVALVRFPHGGTFEIPELTVNNNHREAKRALNGARDAIGIHPSVAERLSGADFDGDTVLVIPNPTGKIKATPALEGLKGFNPRETYREYPGMKVMTDRETGIQMGDITNLITDMTIQKASTEELARAVRHSMVVIDAAKHKLNWRQSAADNNVADLKRKYQGGPKAGAATLISRKKSELHVPERKLRTMRNGGPIDKETGRRVFEETGRVNFRTGRPILKGVSKLDLADDAHTLSSGTTMERVYADHSNKLKTLANQARLEAQRTPSLKYSPSAKLAYAAEVATLNSKLHVAQMNAPRERQAQVLANSMVAARKAAEPGMDGATLKKVKALALNEARARTGARKTRVEITQREWDAIQAGAISGSKLRDILLNADMDRVKDLATPKAALLMTPVKTQRAQQMSASGYTRAEIASALGVSLTTLGSVLNPSEGA